MLEGFQLPIIIGFDKQERAVDASFGICPRCKSEKLFRLIEFSTAFVVLAIPLRRFGKKFRVRCTGCNCLFSQSMIKTIAADPFAELALRIRRLLLTFLIKHDLLNDRSVLKLCEVWQNMFNLKIDITQLDQDCESIVSHNINADELARHFSIEESESTRWKTMEALVEIIRQSNIDIAQLQPALIQFGVALQLEQNKLANKIAV
jgi:hypothetical protein